MIFYKVLLFSAVIVVLVILYFFVAGIMDGTVTGQNIGLWILILAIIFGIAGGGYLLRTDHIVWAKLLLAILALPGWIGLFYLLVVVLSKSRWN